MELRKYQDSPLMEFLHRDGNRENQEQAIYTLLELISVGFDDESARPPIVRSFMDTLCHKGEDDPEKLLCHLQTHLQQKQDEYGNQGN